jgi:site-specific recombinase XerD
VKVETITTIFPRAKNALGIEDLHFHDLRHEGVSRLFEQGYQIHEVALMSGHRDWKMLARYTQLKAKDLHRRPVNNQPVG